MMTGKVTRFVPKPEEFTLQCHRVCLLWNVAPIGIVGRLCWLNWMTCHGQFVGYYECLCRQVSSLRKSETFTGLCLTLLNSSLMQMSKFIIKLLQHLPDTQHYITNYCLITVKPLMFVCPPEPNKTAKFKGTNINCRPKIGRNYYRISNYMVLIRQNKGAKIFLHAKSPTFRAAKLKGFTVLHTEND